MTASARPIASTTKTHTSVEAADRLRRSGYLALRDVSCDVRGEHARLLGRVPSQYLKQVAQAIVAGIDGVQGVTNLIEVTAPRVGRPSGDGSPASSTATVASFIRTRG